MGRLTELTGARVYCDTNVVIYAIEGYDAYAPVIQALLRALDEQAVVAVTSELTIAEVLVKPLRDGNHIIQQAYRRFLRPSSALSLFPISRKILEQAAGIRAAGKVKLPDAIHWATALSADCNSFLTNDQAFKAQAGLTVHLISEITLS